MFNHCIPTTIIYRICMHTRYAIRTKSYVTPENGINLMRKYISMFGARSSGVCGKCKMLFSLSIDTDYLVRFYRILWLMYLRILHLPTSKPQHLPELQACSVFYAFALYLRLVFGVHSFVHLMHYYETMYNILQTHNVPFDAQNKLFKI